MAIFLNADSKVIVQGMTGSEGMKHTQRMLKSGTTIVGGVNPRKAGTTVDFEGGVSVPVYGTVKEAIEATGANVSVIFVPGRRSPRPPPSRRSTRASRSRSSSPRASRQGHRGVLQLRQGQGHDAHRRPELPRPHHPGRQQRRHHPGRHLGHRPHRPRLEVGHADLPDDVRAA